MHHALDVKGKQCVREKGVHFVSSDDTVSRTRKENRTLDLMTWNSLATLP